MTGIINRLFSVENLKETVMRFPLSVMCVVGTFIFVVLDIHDLIDIDDKILARWALVFTSLYLWFGIVRLVFESKTTSMFLYNGLIFGGAIAFSALFFASDQFWIHSAFTYPALLLGLMFAPYLSGGDDWSFWQFNRQLWVGVALSLLAACLFGAGLSSALAAIDHLFGVDVNDDFYGDIWAFSFMILGAVYALSRVPKKFEFSKEECDVPPGLKFIANWVSVPIVFVYLAILYAYFIKIVFSGEIPDGQLVPMIAGFVGTGVLTYLASWFLYKKGEGLPQLNLFYKIFFPALFIPVGFHFFAIWERISAYGITEQRYVLVVLAFWFLIIAMSKSLKNVPLRIIPVSLCVLLALSSFGPWGAVSVSGKSQFSRLEKLLNKYDLLHDGHVVSLAEGKTIPLDDRVSICSILSYMSISDRKKKIEPLFNVEGKGDWKYNLGNMTKQLGFKYVYYRSVNDGEKFSLSPRGNGKPTAVNVVGYDMLVESGYVAVYRGDDSRDKVSNRWEKRFDVSEAYEVILSFDGDKINIVVGDYEPVIIDIVEYVSDKLKIGEIVEDFFILGNNKDLSYKVNFSDIHGIVSEGRILPERITFNFLFKVKE